MYLIFEQPLVCFPLKHSIPINSQHLKPCYLARGLSVKAVSVVIYTTTFEIGTTARTICQPSQTQPPG
ncbi:hypothetical protein SAMN05444359_13110 [Neolewinella agarilytica]|uniref:Uncharacterized protein n=1 Tax=Neolewinella agarilytica TaxID=478744 RepID=A0A1H9MR93_9BACT|nr:hypothetical protein SAMN05444359_13110 [Neolewinella agarilytica]